MKNSQLVKEKAQIDRLFSSVRSFSSDPSADPEITAMLTYYLCVKVSGFMEKCVRIILLEYAKTHSRDRAIRFIEKKLERFPNPSMNAIADLVKNFDEDWAKDFRRKVDEPSRTSIDSINTNRNVIAHGGTSTITLRELEGYYNGAINVILHLENLCV
jgi:hypothetical protein